MDSEAKAVLRFSRDNWLDYGRSKYYLEKANWNADDATKLFKSEIIKDPNVPEDWSLHRSLRASIRTSPESEKEKLPPGKTLVLKDGNDVAYLTEGEEEVKRKSELIDTIIRNNPELDVGQAKFYLDKCGQQPEAAQNLIEAKHPHVSEIARRTKKLPSQILSFVDGEVICNIHNSVGPAPDCQLDLLMELKERSIQLSDKPILKKPLFTNGEAKHVLDNADWDFEVAFELTELYYLYKQYGIYDLEFRKEFKMFINKYYQCYLDSLKSSEERMKKDNTISDTEQVDEITFQEFCKSYSLFQEKSKKQIPHKEKTIEELVEYIDISKSNLGESIKLVEGEILTDGQLITEEIKIQAFKCWTHANDYTARKILLKVNWDMKHAVILNEIIKGYPNKDKSKWLKIIGKTSKNFQDIDPFVEEIRKRTDEITESQKYKENVEQISEIPKGDDPPLKKTRQETEKSNKRTKNRTKILLFQFLHIWTSLNYGSLLQIFKVQEEWDIWGTLTKIKKYLEHKDTEPVIRSTIKMYEGYLSTDKRKQINGLNYVEDTNLIMKKLEKIIVDIPVAATKKKDYIQVKNKMGKKVFVIEGQADIDQRMESENDIGISREIAFLKVICYKNGVEFDGRLNPYQYLSTIKFVIKRRKPPFKPQYADREVMYRLLYRMDEDSKLKPMERTY